MQNVQKVEDKGILLNTCYEAILPLYKWQAKTQYKKSLLNIHRKSSTKYEHNIKSMFLLQSGIFFQECKTDLTSKN